MILQDDEAIGQPKICGKEEIGWASWTAEQNHIENYDDMQALGVLVS